MNFSSFGSRTWHQKSIKNLSQIKAQDEVPLSIDFGSILMGFERQVGMENRAKSDPKWIGKRIEKMIKKKCVWKASWRVLGSGGLARATAGGGILDPQKHKNQRKSPNAKAKVNHEFTKHD